MALAVYPYFCSLTSLVYNHINYTRINSKSADYDCGSELLLRNNICMLPQLPLLPLLPVFRLLPLLLLLHLLVLLPMLLVLGCYTGPSENDKKCNELINAYLKENQSVA